MDERILRDAFFDYFGETEKVREGKTFVSLPTQEDMSKILSRRNEDSYGNGVFSFNRESRSNDNMENGKSFIEEKKEQDEEEQHKQYYDSIAALEDKEMNIEYHGEAVRQLMTDLDEAFQKPQGIYGDIEPDEELLPSQVTLLRMRRKHQERAIARYRFQKSVSKYIEWWREKIVRRYQTIRCRKVARRYVLGKAFGRWHRGQDTSQLQIQLQLYALDVHEKKCLSQAMNIWKSRPGLKKGTKTVKRDFTSTFCAWKRWRNAFRCHLRSSLVMMQADMTAYEALIKKHGRMVFNRLHVKRPLINPKIVANFVYTQVIKRGMRQLSSMHMASMSKKARNRKADDKRKLTGLLQWKKYIEFCHKRKSVHKKERQMVMSHQKSNRSKHLSLRVLSLRTFLDRFAATLRLSVLAKARLRKGKVFFDQKSLRFGLNMFYSSTRLGCQLQEAETISSRHFIKVRSILCFSIWKDFTRCKSERNDGSNGLLSKFIQQYSRQCVLNNKKPTKHVVASQNRLNRTMSSLHHKKCQWEKLLNALFYQKQSKDWALDCEVSSKAFHANYLTKHALEAWIQHCEIATRENEDGHSADVFYCIRNMRSRFLHWHAIARDNSSMLPLYSTANRHFSLKIYDIFLQKMHMIKDTSHQNTKAESHWKVSKCREAMASWMVFVNRGYDSISRLCNTDNSLALSLPRNQFLYVQNVLSRNSLHLSFSRNMESCQSVVCHYATIALSYVHYKKRLKRGGFQEWYQEVLNRKYNRKRENSYETQHYHSRLLNNGFHTLRQYKNHCCGIENKYSYLKEQFSRFQVKIYLRYWRFQSNNLKMHLEHLNEMDSICNRRILIHGMLKWRAWMRVKRQDSASDQYGQLHFQRNTTKKFINILAISSKQGLGIKKAIKYREASQMKENFQLWRRYMTRHVLLRCNDTRVKSHRGHWMWKIVNKRIRDKARSRIAASSSQAVARTFRLQFHMRSSLLLIGAMTARRSSLRRLYNTFTSKKQFRCCQKVFNILNAHRIEGKHLYKAAALHQEKHMLKMAFHRSQRRFKWVDSSKRIESGAMSHHHGFLMLLFFKCHRKHVKQPMEFTRKSSSFAFEAHQNRMKLKRLRQWKFLTQKKLSDVTTRGATIRRFSLRWSFMKFMDLIMLSKSRHAGASCVRETTYHNQRKLRLAMKEWTCHVRHWQRRSTQYSQGKSLFECREKSAVVCWFRRLRQLRLAANSVNKTRLRRYFDIFKRESDKRIACEAMAQFITPRVLQDERERLEEAWMTWCEHSHMEGKAAQLVDMRAERLFARSVSRWRRWTARQLKAKLSFNDSRLHCEMMWRRARLREVFQSLRRMLGSSEARRHRQVQSARSLFSLFQRRVRGFSGRVAHKRCEMTAAGEFRRECLLSAGIRRLHHYCNNRKYYHSVLCEQALDRSVYLTALAVAALRRNVRRRRQLMKLRKKIHQYRKRRQMWQALHILDCASVRHWGQQEKMRLLHIDVDVTQRRKLRGFKSFHRLLRKQKIDVIEQ